MSTYSYGREGARSARPVPDLGTACYQAGIASVHGETWTVHEYPPGAPQAGKLIATYRNGELVTEGATS